MKKLFTIIFICFLSLPIISSAATANLPQKLSGQILLQVQSSGQAWYVNPADQKRYSLGLPDDAFNVMRQLGLGISEADFNKLPTDKNLISRTKGKIILRVQSSGQAYYINPADGKKYYLGRPADAFMIMRNLGLGITNTDLEKITIGYAKNIIIPKIACDNCYNNKQPGDILAKAAQAIRAGETKQTLTYFTPELSKAIEYTMNFLQADGRLTLANILSSSSLDSSNENEKIYSNKVYFSLGGYDVTLKFHVNKQPDGTWLIANL